MFRILLLAVALSFSAFLTTSHAQTPDPTEFERIITSQIEAFRQDKGTDAFAFASPGIRAQFGTADKFMDMVRRGYPQVYRPQSFRFGKIGDEMGGRPTQHLHITDMAGQNWTAFYAFEQQPDGSWRISGVIILRQPDVSA